VLRKRIMIRIRHQMACLVWALLELPRHFLVSSVVSSVMPVPRLDPLGRDLSIFTKY
jgi:hypothetical protein